MNATTQAESARGIVCLRDASSPAPDLALDADALRLALREHAREGRLFFIESEDRLSLRLQVLVGEALPPALAPDFEAAGSFRLDLTTGTLIAAGVEEAAAPAELAVPPGSYLLTVYSREPFDAERDRQVRAQLLDAHEQRHARAVERLGLLGCGTFVVSAVILLIPVLRRYWPLALALLLPWLAYLIAAKLPRYRRIEAKLAAHEREKPAYVLVLQRTHPAPTIPGGWVCCE